MSRLGGLKVIGSVTLEAILKAAGVNAAKWKSALDTGCTTIKSDNPRAGSISFNGSHPHESHTDKTEVLRVMSGKLWEGETEDKRLKSVHINEEGKVKYSK
ncbi:hypothetical protein B0T24DRAFT_142998 [Lasiosphaeria ovina]|uniref:Uncharacterized protein n=1 Tax=Lasiosphaeria ovina TaxID=92902 RepID=A0AAE0KMG2_9PEZI|nr:hypothetical protein B0T24DRAFT_142998 [Lasiosphaeria ovina]